MRSTFQGLETSKRGLAAQQAALQVMGHNINNVNTPGFSRQRVDFSTTNPLSKPGMNNSVLPGQMGTGVQTGAPTRIRDSFLDAQFRTEYNKLGNYGTQADALSKMEDIMNEPSESGLAKQFDKFWKAIQDLAVNPQNPGARSVVLERGKAVAETFNYLNSSLKSVQKDLGNQINVTTKQVNSLLDQIKNINKQIADIEPHGYLPNDLYDQRDMLLDELSGIANIKVSYVKSDGMPAMAAMAAEGRVTIELVDNSGSSMGQLLDGLDLNAKPNYLEVMYADAKPGEVGLVTGIKVGNNIFKPEEFGSRGKLKALVDSMGYINKEGNAVGAYPEMLGELKLIAKSFVDAFNGKHEAGFDLEGNAGKPFFEIDEDGNVKVLIKDPSEIAAAGPKKDKNGNVVGKDGNFLSPKGELLQLVGDKLIPMVGDDGKPIIVDGENIIKEPNGVVKDKEGKVLFTPAAGDAGNGDNALSLGKIFSDPIKINGKDIGLMSYYQGVIGRMGVQAQEATRMAASSETLAISVDNRRQSTSGVSLDEEMINMVKYQHAYNAASRNITMIDEMLDRIINNMGIVGR